MVWGELTIIVVIIIAKVVASNLSKTKYAVLPMIKYIHPSLYIRAKYFTNREAESLGFIKGFLRTTGDEACVRRKD